MLRSLFKYWAFTLLFLFFYQTSASQDKGTQWGGIRGSRLAFSDDEVIQNYGLDLELYVADEFALNYSLTFGADRGGTFYMHSYLGGGAAGILGISALADTSAGMTTLKGLGALVCLFIPEGVSYSFRAAPGFRIAPYFEPLGFDIYNNAFASGKLGTSLKFNLSEKFLVAPYGGIEALYTNGLPIASEFGLVASYRIGKD